MTKFYTLDNHINERNTFELTTSIYNYLKYLDLILFLNYIQQNMLVINDNFDTPKFYFLSKDNISKIFKHFKIYGNILNIDRVNNIKLFLKEKLSKEENKIAILYHKEKVIFPILDKFCENIYKNIYIFQLNCKNQKIKEFSVHHLEFLRTIST